jgi:hypothetical protein
MLIKRSILPHIEAHLQRPEITVITGARQIGKTTILRMLQQRCEEAGRRTLFFNLDVEIDFGYFSSQQRLLEKIRLEAGDAYVYVFIDEMQRRENAGLFLKGIYDTQPNMKLVVSGSGSLELKEKIHESLVGRKRVFEILPVGFEEFVNFRTGYAYEDRLDAFCRTEKERIHALLHDYVSYGGYPAVVTAPDAREKHALMQEIFQSYVRKDLSFLLGLDRPESVVNLIQWLAHTTGSTVNYSTCAADVGISVPTVKKYLWYAQQTFIVHQVSPFYTNKRKEITKAPVVYFFDTGMQRFAYGMYGIEPGQQGLGQSFENMVCTLLYSRIRATAAQLHFWRTTNGAEVDFVVSAGENRIPFEVKSGGIHSDTLSRSFRSFIATYRPANAYVVTTAYRSSLQIEDTRVYFLPFYELRFIETAELARI